MRTGAIITGLAALSLCSGCALAPEYRTFYLAHQDWRGTELSGRGRLVVADIAAGSAPYTITRIEIGGVLELPVDPARRIPILDERARTAALELARNGVAPTDIALEVRPTAEGLDRESSGPLARRMVIVVHYY